MDTKTGKEFYCCCLSDLPEAVSEKSLEDRYEREIFGFWGYWSLRLEWQLADIENWLRTRFKK